MNRSIHFLAIFLFTDIIFGEVEYNSLHDETFWFPNSEFTLEGVKTGSVRSNLVWKDRMYVMVDEENCLGEPSIFVQLSTNKVRTKFPDFDFTSLEDKHVDLVLNFDGKYIENNHAKIINAIEFEDGNHAIHLNLGRVYKSFLAIEEAYENLLGWKVLTIKIQDDDPTIKYFAFPERQYRMLGFRTLMVHLIEECKKSSKYR
jgi:hypothetical protein